MPVEAASELPKSDTVLMPVLFREGADRRASARLPLSSPVRMGPPNGEPYAVVSARDVSMGGLFIDADRPVKVGARFCAEIVLPSGEKVYVPEAEVAYNREEANGCGFGVRFIDAPASVRRAIEGELHRLGIELSSEGSRRDFSRRIIVGETPLEDPGSRHTEVLPRRAKSDEAWAHATLDAGPAFDDSARTDSVSAIAIDAIASGEPTIGAALVEGAEYGREPVLDEVVAPPSDGPGLWEEVKASGEASKARFVERSRRLPLLWTALAVSGAVLVLSAIGLALWTGARAEALEPVQPAKDRGVSAVTHQALVGEHSLPELVEPAKPAEARAGEAEPKRPLPPLVYVEDLEKQAMASSTQGPQVPPTAAPAGASEAVGPAEADRGSKKARPAEHGSKAAPDGRTDKTRTAESKKGVERTRPARTDEAKAAEGTSDKAHGATKLARSERGERSKLVASGVVRMTLGPKASVVRTHVLRGPDRFVIDLAGQDAPLALPAPGALVRSARFGRHSGFARIVLETAAPIASSRLTRSGREVSIALELAR